MLCTQQLSYSFEHFVNVEILDLGQLVGAKQAIDEITQAIGLFHDDPGVLLEVIFVQLQLEQLRGATNAAERILDFMRESAHQFLGSLLLADQLLLVRNANLPVYLLQLDEKRPRQIRLLEWNNCTVDRQALARRVYADLPARVGVTGLEDVM